MEQIKLTHSPLHPTQTPPASALMQTAKPAQRSPKTPPRFGNRKKTTHILQISLCVPRSYILMDCTHKGVWIFRRFAGHVKAISCGPGPIKSPDVAFDGPSGGVMAVENCSRFLTHTHARCRLDAKELLSRQTVNKRHFNKTPHSPKANITCTVVLRTQTSRLHN